MTIRFSEYLNEASNNTQKTQVATTGGTYTKTGEFLHPHLPAKAFVLSHGAGLDHTKSALQGALGKGRTVHDFEPNPGNRKNPPEYTEDRHIPRDRYDAVVSHNVLNVVEPKVRERALDTMFGAVKSGGHIVIGTRKWKGDIDKTKNYEPVTGEPQAIWVTKGTDRSYQRGFDGDQLKDYVEEYARKKGHQVTVKNTKGIAATGIHIQVHSK